MKHISDLLTKFGLIKIEHTVPVRDQSHNNSANIVPVQQQTAVENMSPQEQQDFVSNLVADTKVLK